jgi:hypothetical protein
MANPYGYPGGYAAGPRGQEVVELPSPTRDDVEHLHLLRIGYYVMAGLTAIAGLIPLIHVGIGAMMAAGMFAAHARQGAPPPFIGWIVVGFGIVIIAFIETMTVLSLLAARALRDCRQRTFLLAVGCLHLLHAPLGTLLGVLSILVLSRPSVRAAFDQGPRPHNP